MKNSRTTRRLEERSRQKWRLQRSNLLAQLLASLIRPGSRLLKCQRRNEKNHIGLHISEWRHALTSVPRRLQFKGLIRGANGSFYKEQLLKATWNPFAKKAHIGGHASKCSPVSSPMIPHGSLCVKIDLPSFVDE